MRTKHIISWIVFALVLGMVIFWWTTAKNRIVKQAVTKTVTKKTDSLYRIKYDTATIDELGGNIVIHHLSLQLDSIQWLRLVQKDSMPGITLGLTIDKITIHGLKEVKLLGNHALDVSSITLEKPVFHLYKWAATPSAKAKENNDTLEVYKRLTGAFDFLRAKSIDIIDGKFLFDNYLHNDSVEASGINISVDDFLVDSAHNYQSVIAYFVAQTKATVQSVSSRGVTVKNILYDSRQHLLRADSIVAGKKSASPFFARSVSVTGFNPASFVYHNQFIAQKMIMDAPDIVVGHAKEKGSGIPVLFSGGQIDSFVIQKGNILVLPKKPGEGIRITGMNALLKKLPIDSTKIGIDECLNPIRSEFTIASVILPIGLHRVHLYDVKYPAKENADIVSVTTLKMLPKITREQLENDLHRQADLYFATGSHVMLEHFDLPMLLKNTVSIGAASMQLDLLVFNNKTLPENEDARNRDKFPYEKLLLLKTGVNVHTIYLTHSKIAYEEKAANSGMNGKISFEDVAAKITNFTNIKAAIEKDSMMRVEAHTRVMGQALFATNWSLPLSMSNSQFYISGNMNGFEVSILNQAFERLSMATIKSGSVEKLDFSFSGNHEGVNGKLLLNYHDLHVDLLKKNKNDSLQKKWLVSFLANKDIKNNNHSAAKDFHFKQRKYRSFFNLLWNGVFQGAKENALIVKKL